MLFKRDDELENMIYEILSQTFIFKTYRSPMLAAASFRLG